MKKAIKKFLRALLPVKLRPKLKAIYGRVYRLGFRYECPFCNSQLERFRPSGFKFPVLSEKKVIGGGYRPNARCPVCGSIDRDRLLYLYLLQKTDIFEKPKKVLHIAPEISVEKILRKQKVVDYLTADLCAKDVMLKMDVTNVQFPDSSFDVII